MVHADNSSSLANYGPRLSIQWYTYWTSTVWYCSPRQSVLAGIDVEPVLSFHSRLALVKDLPAGASLSYGCEKILERDSRIGVIAAGYGDAIPYIGGKAQGLIGGNNYPIVGRVTMDQTLIDLTGSENEPKTGEVVTLIGRQNEEQIGLSELAKHGNTIEWELLCSITKRYRRVYLTKRE